MSNSEPIGEVFCRGDIGLGTGCKRCGRCAIQLAKLVEELKADAKMSPSRIEWRNLAYQFDAHRMSAIMHIQMLIKHGDAHREAAIDFLKQAPTTGNKVLMEYAQAMKK